MKTAPSKSVHVVADDEVILRRYTLEILSIGLHWKFLVFVHQAEERTCLWQGERGVSGISDFSEESVLFLYFR